LRKRYNIKQGGLRMAFLTGKVALVTGSSRGIGRAIAERLGREGASVVVHYVQRTAQAEAVVAAIAAFGGQAIAVQADMRQRADIRRLSQVPLQQFGRLDIVVNNVGINRVKRVAEASEEDYDTVFAVNARGTFFALQEAARHLADGGRIVNISSGVTALAKAGVALYCGSKAAVEQFTKALAHEVAGRGITVNTVSPGSTETDMLSAQIKEERAQLSSFKRIGQPEDIAEVVAFLVSDGARWLTGQNIRATGGSVIRRYVAHSMGRGAAPAVCSPEKARVSHHFSKHSGARAGPPKEHPREVRHCWRRVRSVLARMRSVLAGVPAVGEPLVTGGVGCRGMLGTDLPLRPDDRWHRWAWQTLWEARRDRRDPGQQSSPCAARGTSVYPHALTCVAIVVTLRARYCAA
jgi:3-oxoacyl-[acyl-carrier protein] reductase